MNMPIAMDLNDLVSRIPNGAKLAVPKDTSGAAMAATRELVRRGVRDLYLVCVPVGGLQADILIGAGCVATIETSAVSLGEFGPAPRFSEAARGGTIKILDATCPAIYAGLQAAEKGLPFMPLRGIIGSDILAQRSDWRVIDNPFQPGDKIVALAAIQPDIALFHAPLADRFGNVFIGRDRELMTLAHAARETLVTVEEITDGNLLNEETRAGATIPALYISAVAQAVRGAAPLGFLDQYGDDEKWLSRYAALAQSKEGFREFIAQWCGEEVSVTTATV
jgi:glutaconate CoA-transferase, subunit A